MIKPTATQKLLVAAVVLQGMILGGTWLGQPSSAMARGEVKLQNPGERQLEMIEELKALNARVERLTTAVTGGEITVKLAKEEK